MRETILFLAPPFLALAAPGAVAFPRGARGSAIAGGTTLALAALLGGVAAGVGAAVLMAAWTAVFACLAASLRRAGVPRAHAMGAAGLAAVLLLGTLFWLGPAGDYARNRGVAGARVTTWTDRSLDLHPYVAAARFAPGRDPLRRNWMYTHSSLADHPYVPAPWMSTAAAYLALAAVSFVPAAVRRAVRRARGR